MKPKPNQLLALAIVLAVTACGTDQKTRDSGNFDMAKRQVKKGLCAPSLEDRTIAIASLVRNAPIRDAEEWAQTIEQAGDEITAEGCNL